MKLGRLGIAALACTLAACLDSPDDGTDGSDDALQLLANPGFEEGVTGWSFMGAVEVAAAEELGLPAPEDGGRVALLGGDDNQMDVVAQELVVPEWASHLELTGQRCFATSEGFDQAYDHLTISIELEGEVEVLVRDSNLDSTAVDCEWLPFRIATSSYAGQEIRFSVQGETDCAAPTSFARDGLALSARR